ncbi:hypothetical protein HOI83_01190 [Candidatus Uhrbacteria bacterium]|jgi:hypothetical protein|nr:hypothetical protein [Candidatus Uhrbacteria bacterium]
MSSEAMALALNAMNKPLVVTIEAHCGNEGTTFSRDLTEMINAARLHGRALARVAMTTQGGIDAGLQAAAFNGNVIAEIERFKLADEHFDIEFDGTLLDLAITPH